MDENVKNDAKQVMLVQNADDGRLQAVTGVDQDGNIQTLSLIHISEPTRPY
mgnify:FL=1